MLCGKHTALTHYEVSYQNIAPAVSIFVLSSWKHFMCIQAVQEVTLTLYLIMCKQIYHNWYGCVGWLQCTQRCKGKQVIILIMSNKCHFLILFMYIHLSRHLILRNYDVWLLVIRKPIVENISDQFTKINHTTFIQYLSSIMSKPLLFLELYVPYPFEMVG